MVTVDGLSSAHWVLIQYVRLGVPGDLGGGARAAIMTGTWLASCSMCRAWSRKLSGLMLRRTTTAGARDGAMSATALIGLSVPR
jgi:hypothetical protein